LGSIYALLISLLSLIYSIGENIDPYFRYKDNSFDIHLGTRNYFFGPGFHQLGIIIGDSFSNLINHAQKLKEWKDNWSDEGILKIFIWVIYVIAFDMTFIFGSVWILIFSIVISFFCLIGFSVFFVFYSLLWSIDRIALFLNSYSLQCGNCKKTTILPMFFCPSCGKKHSQLTPGPYGIFHRTCSCETRLPTTILHGRTKLTSCCSCGKDFPSSNVRNFAVQIVGGSNSGKTTFLSAFWHLYLARLTRRYQKSPEIEFEKLENAFVSGQHSTVTTEFNSNMYSVVHHRRLRVPYQLNIYDIAGEAFVVGSSFQQQQYKYAERILLIVDPTAESETAYEVLSNFISELKSLTGTAVSKKITKPVAVVITKIDRLKSSAFYHCREAKQQSNPNNSDICNSISVDIINILENSGFTNVLNLLESNFTNINFFSVSAMGFDHQVGTPYQPVGVEAVVDWIVSGAHKHLIELRISRVVKKSIFYILLACILICSTRYLLMLSGKV
jgi:GTPase SAR1 family protein